jgi:hypothetical protein
MKLKKKVDSVAMASSGGFRSEGKRRDSMRKATCSERATASGYLLRHAKIGECVLLRDQTKVR